MGTIKLCYLLTAAIAAIIEPPILALEAIANSVKSKFKSFLLFVKLIDKLSRL